MDDADGACFLFGGKLAVVELNLRGVEGVDVDSDNGVLLGFVAQDKIGPVIRGEVRSFPPAKGSFPE